MSSDLEKRLDEANAKIDALTKELEETNVRARKAFKKLIWLQRTLLPDTLKTTKD